MNYGASWISNLRVNDSNNTVTGTVSENTSTSSRSTTITLTASGNLSTVSPSSFTITQQGKVDKTRSLSISANIPSSVIAWKVSGIIGTKTYEFSSPSTSTTIILSTDDSSAVSGIRCTASFSYRDQSGVGIGGWRSGLTTVTPSSHSYSANEYGRKIFNVDCQTFGI